MWEHFLATMISVLTKCCSYLVVVLVSFIFFGYWFVYHVIANPTIPGMILFNISLFFAFWSYTATCLTDPGSQTSDEWRAWAAKISAREILPEGSQAPRCWMPGSPQFCGKCMVWRPERAHHCKALGTCVLRMDHFCPWIGNCVGFRNHKQFVLMNFYVTLASLVFMFTLREPSGLKALSYGVFVTDVDKHMHGGFARMGLSITVLFAAIFTLLTSMLFGHGIYYAAWNVTQIESSYDSSNPYLLPTSWQNMRQLFGSFSIWLFFPVKKTGGDDCDGTSFPAKKVAIQSGSYGATVHSELA